MTGAPAFFTLHLLLYVYSFETFISNFLGLSFLISRKKVVGRVCRMCTSVFIVFFSVVLGFRSAFFPIRLRAFTSRVLFFLFDEITGITDLTFSTCWLWSVCPFGLSTVTNSVKWNVQTLPLLVLYSSLCSSLSCCDANRLMVLDNVATTQW